ncbi:sigma-54 dependent transcriptional regulator [Vitiosangium sp. GDMCC 1.1324]|uniref:sigma-54-dependent transcriptional regulator n=1 Tax=Vitiosangium sp. (strain GDMCC 1.1324) TaxID=2138576 RepID=UPI000D3B0A52|nr:sigma 54-interacting transcriptional regulator [Vitiosangium sp. GDMCC 1.1324]PTL81269.1 sigma-54-dependent Fis family transcriptional regulator [Vitiosangium sp. GDMCC 1.1324]
MFDQLPSVVTALQAARHFEQAARVVLRTALLLGEEALEASAFAREGRLLRGVVHLRPDDAYRRLVSLEWESLATSAPGEEPLQTGEQPQGALLTSASAWRAVVEHGCALSIDVGLGTLSPHEGAARGIPAPGLLTTPFTPESQERLLSRQTTHVCVLPLRGVGGRIDGMLVLEASCVAAIGQEFIWRQVGPRLQLAADLAAPYLSGLPHEGALPETDEFLPVVGASMANLIGVLRVFAQQEETLLISGPTGAGKSRLARWCHERSARRRGSFESLDLMMVPEELQMGELFGWRRGAFTGAVRDNPGCLARAQGGTLFIDEIDKLSLKAQAGLLHVLEERTYRTLGDAASQQRANVRFIIGTNADLRESVRRGTFREDLFYRINVLPVRVPPLEERRDEIAAWARYMLERHHQEKTPAGVVRLSADAEKRLESCAWPGNLRQLDNIIRRAYTLALVQRGGVGQELELRESHVEQALAYEEGRQESLVGVLGQAARAFVQEAQRRESPLDIDFAECLRGFVLAEAVQQVGREEAFRLLGRESLVKSRNHLKALRQELKKAEALCKEVGQPIPALFAQAEGTDSRGTS